MYSSKHFLALAVVAAVAGSTHADETCNSPYMSRLIKDAAKIFPAIMKDGKPQKNTVAP